MKRTRKIINRILLLVVSLVLIFIVSLSLRKVSVVKETKKIVTTNFEITYRGILDREATGISEALESNYHRIRTALTDPEHARISVFIHPTQEEFNSATGLLNSTANGTSRGPLVFHIMYETWFNSIFPPDMKKVAVHEFTHCVQLNILVQDALSKISREEMTGFDERFEAKFMNEYPQWLWEALCDYEANMVNSISVWYGMKDNPTLQELNSSRQIYNVGYTIIEYFVAIHGKEKLPEFIRSYGNFEQVLGVTEKEFEAGWQLFVDEKY